MHFKHKLQAGFTLIELIIVVTIVALLLIFFAITAINQLAKSRDAQRKTDLHAIRQGFDSYYDDNMQYPDVGVLENCGEVFENYIREIPCDPLDGSPYIYEPNGDFSAYRVLAKLENEEDPVITELACDGTLGCGYPNRPNHNYGVAQGRRVSDSTAQQSPQASPTPDICLNQPMLQFTCEEDNIPPTCQACGEQGCVVGNGVSSGPYRCLAECIAVSICDE